MRLKNISEKKDIYLNMFFEFITCRKCGNQSLPNYELTVDSYKDEGFFIIPLDLPTEEPPVIPTYMVCECTNPDCRNIEKIEHKDILNDISKGLATAAWRLYKQELNKSEHFEQYMTRFILDRGVNTFIREENLSTHPILKEYLKLIRNVK